MNKVNNFFLENRPEFVKGVANIDDFLQNSSVPEIAFIGRSNVGKSSLINSITSSNIAKTSKTPGRTREINLFSIGSKVIFVDMPGYGFAFAEEEEKYRWRKLIYDYFTSKNNLARLFVLIDSRRGIAESDLDLFDMLENEKFNFDYQIILTKVDSINRVEYNKLLDNTREQIKNYGKVVKDILFSSTTKKYGIGDIRKTVYYLVNKK